MSIDLRDMNGGTAARARLVEMWRNNLRKSQQALPEPALRPTSINFGFGGGGQPILTDPILLIPTGVDPYLVDIPYPCKIIWARMRAMDALGQPALVADASVDVQIHQFLTFGASAPLYGTGFMPQLLQQSSADLALTGWNIYLSTGDSLTAVLHSFTGIATAVSLTLMLRPTDAPQGVTPLTTTGGVTMTGANGQPLTIGVP